jgi:hypothetical protein
MRQEVGETSKAIVEDDEKIIEKILSDNKDRQELYWIVLFAKPAKGINVEGKPTLIKVVKAYYTKPRQMVGMVVGEVNNPLGTIRWEVNMPDKPFGYEVLGLQQDGTQVYETSIPQSYTYT